MWCSMIFLKCGINRLRYFSGLHLYDHFSGRVWGKKWVIPPLPPAKELWEQFMPRDLSCTLRQVVCGSWLSKIKEKLKCNYLKLILKTFHVVQTTECFCIYFFLI